MKICFTASSGGHLDELMMLYPLMKENKSFILTEKAKYSFDSKGIKTYQLVQINRRELLFPLKVMINLVKSYAVFLKEQPNVIISTGALATVPICLIAKFYRKKIIFIESFSKVNSPTLTGKFLYKKADVFIIQWEGLQVHYPNAVYGGGIF